MTDVTPTPDAQRWRIDRFRVPEAARAALIDRLAATHAALGRLDGCLINRVVAGPVENGWQEMMTLVAWRDAAAMAAARAHMQRIHAETGFDAASFLGQLGVTMIPGTYRNVFAARAIDPAP